MLRKSVALHTLLRDRRATSDDWKHIGYCELGLGHRKAALDAFRNGLTVAEALGDLDRTARSLSGIGEVHRAEGRLPQATADYRKVIATIEKLRAQAAGDEQEQPDLFERHVDTYHTLIGLLLKQGAHGEALAYAERARSRVLLDVLRRGGVEAVREMTPSEHKEDLRLTGALVALNSQIYQVRQGGATNRARLADLTARREQARRELRAFRSTLYTAQPGPRTTIEDARPVTAGEAIALLPHGNGSLLEFVVTEEQTYLFIVTQGRPGPALHVFGLPIPQAELSEQVTRFRHRVAQRDIRSSRDARALYDRLLKPAERLLAGRTAVVIVPDGPLWELPFQALQPRPGRYLVEQFAISYAPSLTVLRELRRSTTASSARGHVLRAGGRHRYSSAIRAASAPAHPQSRPATVLLAVGNPDLGAETKPRVQRTLRDARLDPLPETEVEVRALARIYGPAASTVLVGAEAHEGRVKSEAGTASVIHLGTHMILDDRSPMYSSIVLSQARMAETAVPGHVPREDGLLEAWEMVDLHLRAEILVLAGCQTARGKIGAGEGVIGMIWAVFLAGCPTTVASGWKVESRSTTRLMLAFHRQLQSRLRDPQGSVSKAEALRRAQLLLLRSDACHDPFYWAGFALFGDGR